MAFAVFLLLWLVLGIIDMGRAIFTNIALQEVTQAGVAHAAFTETVDASAVETVAIGSTDSLTLTGADIEIACQSVSRTDQNAAQVRVTTAYELDLITPLVGQALGGTIELTKTAEAERYFDSCSGLQEVSW